jgi:hypothetical protein
VHKESGRPFPKLSDDPVNDYLVMEAIVFKAQQEDRQSEETAKREAWKSDFDSLRKRLAEQ